MRGGICWARAKIQPPLVLKAAAKCYANVTIEFYLSRGINKMPKPQSSTVYD